MNREHLLQAFDSYTSSYDLSDPKIKLKYIHTKKVAENAESIAQSLGLSLDDINLCWELGMLHDIGRFEQIRRFHTFLDSESIDHAAFGADLLFREGLIAQFDDSKEHNQLLELAIRCHNRYELPNSLNERELLFCQVIRDADKIDIYRANYTTGMEAIYNVSTAELKQSSITPAVYQSFLDHHTVLRDLTTTSIDHLVSHLSLYYGLVYEKSRQMAREQGYLRKLAEFHSENPDAEQILRTIQKTLFPE